MASMAAFFPFNQDHDGSPKVDSLGIYVIGHTSAIKMAYSPAVVGGHEPQRMPQDALTVQHIVSQLGPGKGDISIFSFYLSNSIARFRLSDKQLHAREARRPEGELDAKFVHSSPRLG